MAGSGAAAAVKSAAVPLQWPLVERHDEVELFTVTLVDPRAHGFVIHGPAGSARPAWPTSAWPSPTQGGTWPGRRRRRGPAVPLGALAHLLPAGIGDERATSSRWCPRCGRSADQTRRAARAVRGRPPPPRRDVGDVRRPARRRRPRVPRRHGAPGATLPGLEPLWHRARVRRIDLRPRPAGGRHAPSPGAARPRRGHDVAEIWTASRATSCSCASSCSALSTAATSSAAGRVAAGRAARHDASAARGGRPPASACLPRPRPRPRHVAVWEPAGLATPRGASRRDPLEALDRPGCSRCGRTVAARGDARPPAVRRDPAERMPVLTPAPPARARRPDRRPGRPAPRGPDPRRPPGSTLPARPTPAARPGGPAGPHGQDFPQVERLAPRWRGHDPGSRPAARRGAPRAGPVRRGRRGLTAAEARRTATTSSRPTSRRSGPATDVGPSATTRRCGQPGRRPAGSPRRCGSSRSTRRCCGPTPAVPRRARGPRHDRRPRMPPARALCGRWPRCRPCSRPAAPTRRRAGPCRFADQLRAAGPDRHTRSGVTSSPRSMPGPGRHWRRPPRSPPPPSEATPPTSRPMPACGSAHQQGREHFSPAISNRPALARGRPRRLRGPPHRGAPPPRAVRPRHRARMSRGQRCGRGRGPRLDRLPPFPFTPPEQELAGRGHWWPPAILPGARHVLLAVGDARRHTSGYRASEAWLLHDVARLGGPAVADRLAGTGR